ncbi:putative disease resistance RPP13-like protein 1 [Vitis riparia]|uniref:putative disease resistance RPP13-like protein 1 n=1 Tax=Vitis riparia TaxID=96939 RepID=UPI00155A3D6B|nr:putative disease resistance RPP13-like protein 1 [Vitis riparia]XP_034703239.1 putative disease resistance RPP13-like protein 1 [Vitis riparia]XP_034703240.1 putative disease resistance RPP13-like protein 1 [Vitis riparia]XP_034703241.1 putative disease resistance RPP13-like protein 1 [Vitis riparia]
MELVAEAVLSVSLEALFSQLGSPDLLKFARQEKIHAELEIWEKKLLEIHEVLNDAEEKQITKKSVKTWLGDLRDLAYDMEDILEEFAYEALRRKMMAEADGEGRTSKVRKFIPTCCTSFTPIEAMRNVKMGSKIKEMATRLEAIYAQKAELGLDKVATITQSAWERPLTTSLVYEPWVYGRDADKQIIIDMLLRDEPIETNVSVVSIVAMGCMGKTTLARLVYDDVKTAKHFDLKAWVCVSDQFDAVRITKTILNSVDSQSSTDSQDFNQIQDKLREKLKGKKFLLVLDDMWNDDYGDWCCLQSPFLLGSRGSKIIVTTRSKKVANMMEGDKNLHELQNLSDDECWSVFKKHAFGNSSIDEHSNLALIGKEIVRKCGGLPLAATALGGLLRHEQREDKWNVILTSKIWDLRCGILPALRLSYNHLPSPLKRCFSYCAIFSKDYEFDKRELIRLWMAESLIQRSECYGQQIEIEDLGDDYFQELLSRSFFQPSSSNKSQFVMHDLVNDLAKFVGGEICFSLEENLEGNQQQTISKKAHHSSFLRGQYDVFKKFEAFYGMEYLRTFIALPIHVSSPYNWLSNKVLEELMPKLRRLRVLSLSGYWISEIPSSVGDLKHLRYLNLSGTRVKWLPDSIGNFYNLETLILSYCSKLIRLPLSIENLNNLRHLDVTNTNLEEMLPQICKLKSLQVLSNFIVSKDNGLNIKELRNMSHLQGRLCISNLENVANVQDGRVASLNKKEKLEELTIVWSARLDDSHNARNQIDVLDSLQPHFNLNKLKIKNYGGPEFPRWIGDVSFSKMVNVYLVNCRNCTSLPCLGWLPMLKHVRIEGLNEVKIVGREFYGETCLPNKPFPSLESLSFSDMSQWEDWESPTLSEPYPCLLHLKIVNCPKLIKKLPTNLPSLVHLSIWRCPQLVSPVERLPSLSKLQVEDCNEAVLRSGLELPSLTELGMDRMVGLTRLHEGCMRLLSGLQVLDICGCDELTCLWENGFDGIQQLQTSSCPELVSLGEKEKHELPSKLQSLKIRRCNNLEKLPNGLHRLTCLGELEIYDCPKLVSFPELGFPPMLRRLVIDSCEGLRCLPDWMMVMKDGSNNGSDVCLLEYLRIDTCPSLIGFLEGELPTTLKEFIIYDCEKLDSLPGGMMHHDSNTTTTTTTTTTSDGLHVLNIEKCPSLTFFPTGKFPSTLKKLAIWDCAQLESISEEMFHSSNSSLEYLSISSYPCLKIVSDCLYKLRELKINNCENVELQPYHLQNLTALTSLSISNCENIKTPLSRWGLATLTSLKKLIIGGIFPQVASFSDDQRLSILPTTLTFFSIKDFPNLKSLSSLALQTLTSLEELWIQRCPKLQSLCPREGLPDTLSQLRIRDCLLLKQRCSKGKGQDWPNIAHIPCVEIDREYLF